MWDVKAHPKCAPQMQTPFNGKWKPKFLMVFLTNVPIPIYVHSSMIPKNMYCIFNIENIIHFDLYGSAFSTFF